MTVLEIRRLLIERADPAYRDFQIKLIPNIDPKTLMGVRMPQIKDLVKELRKKDPQALEDFMDRAPYEFFEETMAYIQALNGEKDLAKALKRVEAILPYMDNWALTDACLPKAFIKEPDRVLAQAKKWAQEEEEFVGRYGVFLLMRLFLKGPRAGEVIDFVASLRSEAYYLKMVLAWFFAEALLFEPEKVVEILEDKALDPWVHNKAIQKARESRRLSKDLKDSLAMLRV